MQAVMLLDRMVLYVRIITQLTQYIVYARMETIHMALCLNWVYVYKIIGQP